MLCYCASSYITICGAFLLLCLFQDYLRASIRHLVIWFAHCDYSFFQKQKCMAYIVFSNTAKDCSISLRDYYFLTNVMQFPIAATDNIFINWKVNIDMSCSLLCFASGSYSFSDWSEPTVLEHVCVFVYALVWLTEYFQGRSGHIYVHTRHLRDPDVNEWVGSCKVAFAECSLSCCQVWYYLCFICQSSIFLAFFNN